MARKRNDPEKESRHRKNAQATDASSSSLPLASYIRPLTPYIRPLVLLLGVFVLLLYVLPYLAALTPPGIDISLIKEAELRASEEANPVEKSCESSCSGLKCPEGWTTGPSPQDKCKCICIRLKAVTEWDIANNPSMKEKQVD